MTTRLVRAKARRIVRRVIEPMDRRQVTVSAVNLSAPAGGRGGAASRKRLWPGSTRSGSQNGHQGSANTAGTFRVQAPSSRRYISRGNSAITEVTLLSRPKCRSGMELPAKGWLTRTWLMT